MWESSLRGTRLPRLTVFDLCGLAFVDERGHVVDVSTAERDRLILRSPENRREVVRASRMCGTSGRLILLRRPEGLRFDVPDVPEMCQRTPR